MRLTFIVCEASVDERVMAMLTEAGASGYTRLTDAFGNGSHGRREGSPIWPGLNSIIMSAMTDEQIDTMRQRIEELVAEREGRLAIRMFATPVEQII